MLKIIPLGGSAQVNQNMFVYETDKEILLIDCGIGFPNSSDSPKINLLLPDWTYLKDKAHKITGLILTHGHDDHIAGLPYIYPHLKTNFPVFASPLTAAFANQRLKDQGVNKRVQIFPRGHSLTLGSFNIHPILLTHSVPDTHHFLIQTPFGNVYHGTDFKIDLTPIDNRPPDFQQIAYWGSQGIKLLLSDCLNSEQAGFSNSEALLASTFHRELQSTKGKFIVTAMSSNVHRIQTAVDAIVASGRKVAFIGRSIEQNLREASRLKFFHLDKKHIISKGRIKQLPPHKVALIVAGSQGQEGSSLVRAALASHSLVKINPKDKVVFSSDPIPGRETSVYTTIDNISRLGAEVVYSDISDSLHVSGHGYRGDLQLLIEMTRPQALCPIGGDYRHMIQYRQLAQEVGYRSEQIYLLDRGETLNLPSKGPVAKGQSLKFKPQYVYHQNNK